MQEVIPSMMQLWAAAPWTQHYQCMPPPALAPYFTLVFVKRASVRVHQYQRLPFTMTKMGE